MSTINTENKNPPSAAPATGAIAAHASHATLDARAASRAATALYLIVVVAGGVLMGLEIAGAKILAPGFGTSTFVWGSIIGMFMGAMAAGYYVGGRLSDRNPNFKVLATTVSLAGVWLLLIPRVGPQIADAIARSGMGTIMGPLSATLAIFFVPSFLMAMVTPYAVKLRATSLSGVGSVAGNLSALSTTGSIIGTLLTTFVLIPVLFVSVVMQVLGLTLIVVAIASYVLFASAVGGIRKDDRMGLSVMVVMALLFAELWVVFPVEPHLADGDRLLRYEDSSYHEILVTEQVIEVEGEGGLLNPIRVWKTNSDIPWLVGIPRMLHFNENTESAIYPYRGEYANAVHYTDLLHLPLIFVNNPLPKKLLVVGGGGGIIPMQYHQMYGTTVDVAEIDDRVREMSQKYFDVSTDPNVVHFHIGDGRQTLKSLPDHEYDVIVLDAYSSGGQVPFHLMTWEFMSEVKRKLTPRGVLATNIISALKNGNDTSGVRPAALFLAEYKTLTATRAEAQGRTSSDADDNAPLFNKNQVYVFQKVRGGFEDYRNVIIVCTQEEKQRDLEQLMDDVKRLTSGGSPVITIPKFGEYVEQGLYTTIEPSELKTVPVLSDDYAPVDTMYRPVRIDETQGHY